jgi:hypothetical protein
MKDQIVTGSQYVVNGTPLHNGHIVTVVNPQAEIDKIPYGDLHKLRGNPTRQRTGLVAAFDPAYPSTLWWWFAPHQLNLWISTNS